MAGQAVGMADRAVVELAGLDEVTSATGDAAVLVIALSCLTRSRAVVVQEESTIGYHFIAEPKECPLRDLISLLVCIDLVEFVTIMNVADVLPFNLVETTEI